MKRIYLFLILLLVLTSCDEFNLTAESPSEFTETPVTMSLQDNLTVHYIDAGQADATLFQFSDGNKDYNILYDVGDFKRTDVIEYLHKEAIELIDLIIISHPHADHIGQLDKIINQFQVDEIWMSGNTSTTQNFINSIEAMLDNDIAYDEPRAGMDFDIGDLKINILHPKELTGKLNEDSLSVRFTYGSMNFLFTGDAYKNEEKRMIDTGNIQSQFLQLGHHGSNTSSAPEFIEAVNPEVAIYSAGKGNTYGHPHPDVINHLKQKNIEVIGTDTHGTIKVISDGQSYNIETLNPNTERETPISDRACIDINTASQAELTQIAHIGNERAQDLINQRPYEKVSQLRRINGIGKGRLKDIIEENTACVGGH